MAVIAYQVRRVLIILCRIDKERGESANWITRTKESPDAHLLLLLRIIGRIRIGRVCGRPALLVHRFGPGIAHHNRDVDT